MTCASTLKTGRSGHDRSRRYASDAEIGIDSSRPRAHVERSCVRSWSISRCRVDGCGRGSRTHSSFIHRLTSVLYYFRPHSPLRIATVFSAAPFVTAHHSNDAPTLGSWAADSHVAPYKHQQTVRPSEASLILVPFLIFLIGRLFVYVAPSR